MSNTDTNTQKTATPLQSFLSDQWVLGETSRGTASLVNPTTEAVIATVNRGGYDLKKALSFARLHGSPALRAMTFSERAAMIAELAAVLHQHREELVDLATINGGNTRGDAKFDIDGATSTLSYYATLGEEMGATVQHIDADLPIQIGRTSRWAGVHTRSPKRGVAIHINAFNFPAWGFAEKAATTLLAGMPLLVKPASATALVMHRIGEIIVESKCLPKGVFSMLLGGAGDLIDHVEWQDVIAFTGSSATGAIIRSNPSVISRNLSVNIEADSLNAAILGADVDLDSDLLDLFITEVSRDMTQKAGQKCTATRRIFVPKQHINDIAQRLVEAISEIPYGNPTERGVKVGPVASATQLKSVQEGCARLSKVGKALIGGGQRGTPVGIDNDLGFFVSPTLFQVDDPKSEVVHNDEVFGPVAVLMPYDGSADQASDLLLHGGGSLVSSIYSDDYKFLQNVVNEAAPALGRLHLASSKMASLSFGPGTVLPQLIHGGPGRAGGGEELGGVFGLAPYMQQTAIQGFAPLLDKIIAS